MARPCQNLGTPGVNTHIAIVPGEHVALYSDQRPFALLIRWLSNAHGVRLFHVPNINHRLLYYSWGPGSLKASLYYPGIILYMRPANERRHYSVTQSHWLGAYTEWSLVITLRRQDPPPPHTLTPQQPENNESYGGSVTTTIYVTF